MVISWWDLGDDDPSISDLEACLNQATHDEWANAPGLLAKCWLSDHQQRRWGGAIVWAHRSLESIIPANLAAQMIGRPADTRVEFAVPAFVVGSLADLATTKPGNDPT